MYVASLWVAFSMLTTLSYYRLLSANCKIRYIVFLKLSRNLHLAKSSCFVIGKGNKLRISYNEPGTKEYTVV